MKRLLIATSLLTALFAVPAFATTADTTGTVNVTGTVTGKCVVITAGANGTAPSTFGDSIALGELDTTDGTLSTTLSGSTAGAPAGGITKSFRVNCNTGAPKVTLSATALSTTGTPATGYNATVNYTAGLDLDLANSSVSAFTYNTGTSTSTGTSPLAAPLKNAAGNVRVKVYGLNTTAGTDILMAGTYAGIVTVTINNN